MVCDLTLAAYFPNSYEVFALAIFVTACTNYESTLKARKFMEN